ncbi:MAG TPA: FkbM family methyltransferase [Gemmatimonadaceae bacterium]|nr:FkbM family methyltransferase [Gemmatimonadaceae bacterium]
MRRHSRLARGLRQRVRDTVRALTPDRLSSFLLRVGRATMSPEGWRSHVESLEGAALDRSLHNLRRNGFAPARIVDVGACNGGWTRPALAAFPAARSLMIEARPDALPVLEQAARELDGRAEVAIALLGPHDREAVEFFSLEGGTGSSVLFEDSDVPRVTTRLPMTTLDRLLAARGFGAPDLVKLDVQGFELEVLAGAGAALRSAEVVMMEVALWPYNVGAPLLPDVLAFMGDRGWAAYDICGLTRRPQDHTLIQLDLVFVRSGSPLLANRRTTWVEEPASSPRG